MSRTVAAIRRSCVESVTTAGSGLTTQEVSLLITAHTPENIASIIEFTPTT